MARLRRFVSYRRIERPYTRKSKYREKSYIRANPTVKVIRFDMGNKKRSFSYTIDLKSKSDLQIRDNAIESARQTSNRLLETKLGTSNYRMRIKPYPHHILRENPVASGAGADRFSTGMQKAFGKPIGVAAQIKKGQTMMEVSVEEEHVKTAIAALKRASQKLPCSFLIEVKKN